MFSFPGQGGEGRFRLKIVGLRLEGLPTADVRNVGRLLGLANGSSNDSLTDSGLAELRVTSVALSSKPWHHHQELFDSRASAFFVMMSAISSQCHGRKLWVSTPTSIESEFGASGRRP
jgi:hypothetical protein